MIRELEILHIQSPSPVTPLGAKGVAEGNAMSTPACIANAVADALGVAEISVPLTPERMLELLRRGSSAPMHKVSRR
jgi:2-furoyl-CoA dehydrogenase large subunit